MPAGSPPKYKKNKEMEIIINQYFHDCDSNKKNYTIQGLAIALGFCERKSLIDYAGKEEFVHTIKKAKLKIEQQRIEKLLSGEANTAGAIFDLKNNFGHQDVQEKRLTGAGGGAIAIHQLSDDELQELIATQKA